MKRIIIETSISIENNEVYNIVANNVKLYKSNDYSLLKCFEGNRVGCLEQLESDNFTNIEKRTFVTRVNKLRAVMRERGLQELSYFGSENKRCSLYCGRSRTVYRLPT